MVWFFYSCRDWHEPRETDALDYAAERKLNGLAAAARAGARAYISPLMREQMIDQQPEPGHGQNRAAPDMEN